MCIICCSPVGVTQPDVKTLKTMFDNNPHGAGYMTARNGRVEISKGYMSWNEFVRAINYERFGEEHPVVYHFRISTQAGVNPEMTHPFPLTSDIKNTKLLDLSCPIGVAHTGIVTLTTNRADKEYSDTAHYIAEFMRYLVRDAEDMANPAILSAIERTTRSKWALMDGDGNIETVGHFTKEKNGLLFSNGTYRAAKMFYPGGYTGSGKYRAAGNNNMVIREFYEDEPWTL